MPLHQPIQKEIQKINLNAFHCWKFSVCLVFLPCYLILLQLIALVGWTTQRQFLLLKANLFLHYSVASFFPLPSVWLENLHFAF